MCLVALTAFFLFSWSENVEANELNELSDSEDDEDMNDFVVTNPHFKKSADRAVSDSDSDDDEEIDDLHEADLKSTIEKALAKTRKAPRQTLKLMRKYRLEITIVVALFAFRREIGLLLWRVFSNPVQDPETGEIFRRAVRISPTAILKLLILADVIRRCKSNSVAGKSSPIETLLLVTSTGNPLLGALLTKILAPSNPAYIPPIEQHFTFERLNERYTIDGMALQKAIDPTGSPSQNVTIGRPFLGHGERSKPSYNETVIIMDMTELDSSVSRMSILRDEVSFLLSNYRNRAIRPHSQSGNETKALTEELEIIVVLESPGGSAADYALASQQVLRLRNEPGIKVTICVDKVAASGGYMIACTSSPGRLFAAPFAVLGSIGVIGQSFNIQETLEGWGVKPLVFRGGLNKAPVGLIGEVTKEGLAKVQDMVDDTHRAFKRHVASARPIVADRIEDLATGDVWLGYDALDVGLIDRIVTSDEYIFERMGEGARVLKLVQLIRPKFPFSPPTTSSMMNQARMTGSRSLVTILDDFRSLLERVSKSLGDFGVDDARALTKAMTMSDIHATTGRTWIGSN
jgi:signal peptide peptidase SppA